MAPRRRSIAAVRNEPAKAVPLTGSALIDQAYQELLQLKLQLDERFEVITQLLLAWRP